MANDIEITARVTNNTGTGFNRINQSLRNLRTRATDSGRALDGLAARATAAATALGALQQQVDDVNRALRTLRGRAAAADTALAGMRDSTRSAATSMRTLDRNSERAGGRLETLGERSRTLHRDMDTLDGSISRVAGSMGGLRDRLGTVSTSSEGASGGLQGVRSAAVALSPALVAIGAALVPLAASLAAAAGAAATFGVAVIPQIKHLSDAAEAVTKYEDAVKEHGRTSKEAAEADLAHARALEDLPPATREAAAGFQALRDDFNDWSDSLASTTMPVFTKSFALFSAMLPKTSGLVRGASTELDRLVMVAGGAISTPGFDRMMDNFEDFATGSLVKVTRGVVNLSRDLNNAEVHGGLSEFMDFAQKVGPQVGDTLGEIGRALVHLATASADTGVSVLKVAEALAALVNAIPTQLLSNVMQLYLGLKLLRLGMAAVAAAASSSAIARLGAFFQVMRAAGVGATMSALAASMTRMQKAMLGLGVLGAVAFGVKKLADRARGAPPEVDKLTTSLKQLATAGKFTGELKDTFGSIDGLIVKIKQLRQERADLNRDPDGISIPGLDDAADGIARLIKDMKNGQTGINALEDDFKGLDGSLAGLVKSGHADVAADAFRKIEAAARDSGIPMKELRGLVPEYRAALDDLAASNELAARGMGLFGEQAVAVQEKLADQKASADGLRQSIQALNDVNRAGLGGMIGFEAAIDAAAEAATKHAGALSMTKGQLNLNQEGAREAATTLQDLAAKTDEATAAAREQGRSWTEVASIYDRGRQKLISSAEQMGLTTAQAKRLADQILKTPDKTAYLRGNMEDLREKIRDAKRKLREKDLTYPERTKIRATISQLKRQVREAKRQLNGIQDESVWITTYFTNIHRNWYENRTFNNFDGSFAHGGVVGSRARGGVIGAAAAGGPRGNLTWVGEMGPELVSLPAGSTVKTAGDSQRMMRQALSGMGGGTGLGASLGADVAGGLSDGMTGRLGGLEDAVRRVADTLVDTAKNVLGISSPSRVFTRIGDDIGRGLVIGLRNARVQVQEAAKDVADSVTKGAKQAKPASGMQRAIGELSQLVSSGRWNDKGSLLFEDMSFQGMSSNFSKHQRGVADKFWAAVQEVKRARDSGARVHEDMTFKGMSGNVQQFHGMLADIWRGNPWGTTFGDYGKWAPQGADLPRRAAGGIGGGLTWVGERGPELVNLAQGAMVRSAGDSRRLAAAAGGERTVVEIRSGGSQMDDLLLEVMRKSIRVRGGNVQLVLGDGG